MPEPRPCTAAPNDAAVENTAVYARGLTRRFGSFTAVDAISLDVRRGEIFGFLGANGAGKTTAIRMLCGLLPPTAGDARVAGFDVRTQRPRIRASIGYMSQKFSLYEDLSVQENIRFYAGMYGMRRDEADAVAVALFARLGPELQPSAITRSLPLGWKQRLALITAMLHEPAILFLDEPTGGVDPISRRNFWRLIHGIAAGGTTVFVTTHYMDEAEYCHRVSIMHAGRIVELGSPAELKERHGHGSMQDVFLRVVAGRS